MDAEGKVLKQIGNCGYYAHVRVKYEERRDESPCVLLAAGLEDEWLRSQRWIDAALAGAGLGLKMAGKSGTCIITEIRGMVCDTNPTLVAIAAIRAVWSAVSFSPDAATADRMESCILRRSEITFMDLERNLCS